MVRRSRISAALPRLGLVALGSLAGLALLELVLQAWAYVEWSGRHGEGGPTSADTVVLCVGDSFTYGMGARRHDRTYPARLETHLAGRARVVNGGWVGQTSADVLRRLPGQLSRHRPQVVSILVGVNDYGWPTRPVTPAELQAAEDDGTFPLKFRVGRFAQAITGWLVGGGPVYARARQVAPPFVGVWHNGEDEVRIRLDGEFVVDWGATARRGRFYGLNLTWRLEGERLLLDVPKQGVFDTHWELRDRALHMRLPGAADVTVLTPGAARRAGADDGMARRADALVARYRNGETALAGEAVQALLAAGAFDRAFALCVEIQQSGRPLPPISIVEQVGLDPKRHTALQTAAEQALADGAVTGALRAKLLRALFWSLRERAPRRALLALLESECLFSDVAFTRVYLQRAEVSRDQVNGALDTVGATPAQRRAILDLHSEESSGTSGSEEILRQHLMHIVRLCRAAGAQPVLLTYPFRAPRHRRLMAELAESSGVKVVRVRALFESLLQTEPWETLFVLDGHCSDRGYDEIARLAANQIGDSLP